MQTQSIIQDQCRSERGSPPRTVTRSAEYNLLAILAHYVGAGLVTKHGRIFSVRYNPRLILIQRTVIRYRYHLVNMLKISSSNKSLYTERPMHWMTVYRRCCRSRGCSCNECRELRWNVSMLRLQCIHPRIHYWWRQYICWPIGVTNTTGRDIDTAGRLATVYIDNMSNRRWLNNIFRTCHILG